ncbi:MAG TPA: antiactivator of flagellar biosynthesis FleN protein [Noviherbaspirillum sp.]|uniref:MinD/ParA family ATP-binding protein n=1 Tax=Noviherbaspirillum sp. TaxID=1926288 RepID=UPI002D3D4C51|nr:antiactivator of flagellar biosynthesis FleN protein [Noviherbaspirillum sp.]HYD95673.1 antiactivator of flagellar biosynthesis FleN protein [Noviherbaspirillum sp.]
MASFDFDQAEGLRRMLAGPKPRVFTFLSAASADEKGAMLVNLGASLAQAGRDVLLVDACLGSEGISNRLDAVRGATLTQVARLERSLEDVVQAMPQGFAVAALKRGPQRSAVKDAQLARMLDEAFNELATRADIVVVDAELDMEDSLAIPALNDTEIVVQVANSPESIKNAYALIKRLNGKLGRRPFSILVTGATEKEAQVVFENMAKAANRYLAVKLNSMGSVPADEHLKRAMRLGRAVVDAFPLAGASVAFRRLAGRVVLSDVAAAG